MRRRAKRDLQHLPAMITLAIVFYGSDPPAAPLLENVITVRAKEIGLGWAQVSVEKRELPQQGDESSSTRSPIFTIAQSTTSTTSRPPETTTVTYFLSKPRTRF